MDYDELMALYRESLREKRAAIARLWAQLRAEGTEEHVAGLRRTLHHLAGSAGAYGFGLLGENARRLEGAMVAWLALAPEARPLAPTLARRHMGDYEEVLHALDMAAGAEQV